MVLVFSFALTSFADDSVVSGYAVDNVPYNESFDGVLIVSDSGSQLYSSSENRTYKTSSVLSAPSTSSSPLYTFKSVVNMINFEFWRGTESPTITKAVKDGYTGVKYFWSDDTSPHKIYTSNYAQRLSKLKSERKYRFSFKLSVSAYYKGNIDFYLAFPSSDKTPVISLLSYSAPMGGSNFLKDASGSYSIDFTLPSVSDYLIPVVRCTVYGNDFLLYINDFTVTDITTEDLDNSLNKLGDRLENSINPSVPYNEFDDGSFKDSADELKNAENALPTVDFNAIDELANSVDVSSYAQAFSGINQLFIRVVDTVGITPLIFFACFFGFCIFLIGRKLSGG